MGCESYGNLHICRDDATSDWVRSLEAVTTWIGDDMTVRPIRATDEVPVHCCERWVPIGDTETQWYEAFGGYDAGRRFRCAPDKGCNANAGYKRTAHLRCLFP